MHDYDNNSKLDGLEILHGLFHHHHLHEEGTILGPTEPKPQRGEWWESSSKHPGGGDHLTVRWLHSSVRYCLFTPGSRYPGDLLFEGDRKTLWEGTKIAWCSTTYSTEVLFKMTHFGFRVASFLISGDGALLFHFSLSKIVGLHSSHMVVRAKKRRAH